MSLDISILLVLQDFRNGPGAFLAGFLSKMTWLGEINTVIVIMALIYWCVSKDFGTYILMGWSGNRLVNGMLKVTACVYRPWIRDARGEEVHNIQFDRGNREMVIETKRLIVYTISQGHDHRMSEAGRS